MKQTVVFVLSANFSGSHYLSLLVGSHPSAAHLGEVKNLVKASNIGREPDEQIEATRQCHVCGENRHCQLFRDIHTVPASRVYQNLFERADAGIELLVDISKKPGWAAQFLDQDDFECRFVHLLRDPRALVRKWLLYYATAGQRRWQRQKLMRNQPARLFRLMLAPQWSVYVQKWLQQNRAISEFIAQARQPACILTYRDLVCDTQRTLPALMQWLGLEYRDSQLRYWEHEHHGTRKPGYDRIGQDTERYFDLRWQDDLPRDIQRKIALSPNVLTYLDALDVELREDGLTRERLSAV